MALRAEYRIGPLLIWGLVLILAAALTVWFLENFELRTREIDAGRSAEARRNGFLAAERFLRRLGIETESLAGREMLRQLPPATDVIVANDLGILNTQRREALHQWLYAGGRLLVAPTPDSRARGDEPRIGFLGRYGVRFETLGDRDAAERVTTTTTVIGYPEPLQLSFSARSLLVDGEEESDGGIAADDYFRLLQYDIGNGLLTVTNDMDIFTNGQVGELDHALFLALLTQPEGGGKVWFLYDSNMPWLGALLWARAPYGLIAAGALCLALLWGAGGRLGPRIPSPRPGRRDLLVHLQALADFHWRHGRGSRLTRVTRERVERAWVKRHPGLRGMAPSERAVWIARQARCSPNAVQGSLYPTSVDDDGLVEQTRLLQRLWSSLHRGPSGSR